MKVMVMIKGSGADEGKITPTKKMLAEMGAYNEELVKAGIMLDGAGLKPSSEAAQIVMEGGTTSVVDGPFTESKEIIAGYWIWQVRTFEEAVEWAKRCPSDAADGVRGVLELRTFYSAEDFGEEYTPEQKAHDERLAAQVQAQHPDA